MSAKKYQYIAGLDKRTGEIIYSRAQHDCIFSSSGGMMDGGQLGPYTRHGGVEIIIIELPISYGEVYDDWDRCFDKYGKISAEEAKNIKIVPKEEQIDRSSEDFGKYKLWGTYGIDGKGPRKHKCIVDLDTDHLLAILETQGHIGEEYRKIIRGVLENRGERFM